MKATRVEACCLVALVIGLAWGCGGPVVTAAGESDYLVIIRDEGAAQAARALAAVMESPVTWLVDEPAFRAAESSPERFKLFTNRRHVMLVGVWGRGGVERLIRHRVDGLTADTPPRLDLLRDIWAKGQVVGVLMGRDQSELVAYVEAMGDEILTRFEDASVARFADNLIERASGSGVEEALVDRYGWSMCAPKGYDLFSADVDEGFVFFRRTAPDRTVSVWWQDGKAEDVSEEFAIAKRGELGKRYFDGDEIERRRELVVEAVEFAGRPAIRLSGWWGNRTLVGGGPFRTYCFFEPSQGRVYVVDVSLFAPGLDKVPLVRNLDAVAHTFAARAGDA